MGRDRGPDRHLTSSNKRARNLKLLLCALALLLGATVAHGQRLVTTIYLPDSLSGVYPARRGVYSPTNNRIYVGGWGHAIIAIDAATFQKVAKIDVVGDVDAMAMNADGSKLYVAHPLQGLVSVLDVTADSVRAVLEVGVGSEASALCYSERREKLYCTDQIGAKLTVVDCMADTILDTIPVGRRPAALCLDTAESKLYCACERGSNRLFVIDTDGDSVIKSFFVGSYPEALCCNTERNKIYCVNRLGQDVTVVDATTDSIVAQPFLEAHCTRVTYDPRHDKVYCYGDSALALVTVDCSSDTVVTVLLELPYTESVLCDSLNGRAYCGRSNEIVVLEGASDSVMARVSVGNWFCALECQTDTDFVWCMGEQVLVFDADNRAVQAAVAIGCNAVNACYSPLSRKLYVGCGLGTRAEVVAIDVATSAVLRRIWVPYVSEDLCYNRAVDKIYTGREKLCVISCAADSLIDTIPVQGTISRPEICANPDAGKIYYADWSRPYIAIIDAAADTISKWLDFGATAHMLRYNPLNRCIYAQLGDGKTDSMVVVDGEGDTAVARLFTGLTYAEAAPLVLNPITNRLYDCNFLGSVVAVVDCGSNQLLRSFDIPGQPVALCCDTRDNRLYVSTYLGNSVFVIDGVTHEIDSIPVGDLFMGDIFYNPLSNHVYCSDGSHVYVIDASTNLVVDSFQASMGFDVDVQAFALDSIDNRVYVVDQGGSRVLVIQDTTEVAVAEAQTPHVNSSPAPTVVSGLLHLPVPDGIGPRTSPVLLDVSGRKVMDLHPGANDVRALAPGVYFVGDAQAQAQAHAFSKVIVTR